MNEDRPGGATRKRLIGRAVVGCLSFGLVGAAYETVGARAASAAGDVRIFELALEIEYAEQAFYREGLRGGALRGDVREYARTALAQDEQHLRLLKAALGKRATPPPRYEFGPRTKSTRAFVAAASELEDLAVAAYNGQATNLTKSGLAVAATIVSVEARHAAWIRALAGEVAAPDAVDKPMTAAQVMRGLEAIGRR